MRTILIGILVLLTAVSVAEARKKRKKAGRVVDNVYTDNRYNFQFTIDEGWGYRVRADKKDNRLALVQKNPQIPPEYMEAQDYTMIPRLVMYVGKSNVRAFPFLDSLLSDTYKSDQKKEILKECEIMINDPHREAVVPRKKSTLNIGGERGVSWSGQAKYVKEVSKSASSQGGKRVYGSYGGAIWVIQHEGTVIVFNLISEWNYFAEVKAEARQMILSLKWLEADEEPEK